jgi:hypothetical protein
LHTVAKSRTPAASIASASAFSRARLLPWFGMKKLSSWNTNTCTPRSRCMAAISAATSPGSRRRYRFPGSVCSCQAAMQQKVQFA